MTMVKIFLLSFLIIPNWAFSDDNRPAAWFGTFNDKALDETYSIWAETQFRYNLDEGRNQQILYRTGLLQKLNQRHQLGYLFAYIQSDTIKEHRFALQHVHKYGSWIGASFSARTRLEARFVEDNPDDAARFRYLLRADGNRLVVWDELFVNLTDDSWTGNRVVDRNRFFLGLKKQFSGVRLEWGYLNQFIPRSTGNVSEHILTLYLFM